MVFDQRVSFGFAMRLNRASKCLVAMLQSGAALIASSTWALLSLIATMSVFAMCLSFSLLNG